MHIPFDRELAVCSCQHFLRESSLVMHSIKWIKNTLAAAANDEIKLIKWILFSTHETLKFFVAFHHRQPIDWCRISMNIFSVSGAISTLFNASRNYRWMKYIFTNEIDEKCYFLSFFYIVCHSIRRRLFHLAVFLPKRVWNNVTNIMQETEREWERKNWHFEHTYLSASIWSSTSAPPKWR